MVTPRDAARASTLLASRQSAARGARRKSTRSNRFTSKAASVIRPRSSLVDSTSPAASAVSPATPTSNVSSPTLESRSGRSFWRRVRVWIPVAPSGASSSTTRYRAASPDLLRTMSSNWGGTSAIPRTPATPWRCSSSRPSRVSAALSSVTPSPCSSSTVGERMPSANPASAAAAATLA